MSDRERWIVYPLLLLALGVSMRDKLTRTIEADHIMCRDLLVVDGNGKPTLLVGGQYMGQGRSAPGPVISVIGPADQLTAQLGSTIQCGNVIASGLVRANSLLAVNLTRSKSLVADVVQSPMVLITDKQGKQAVKLNRQSFRNLQAIPPKALELKSSAPETQSLPEQQGPKQNPSLEPVEKK